MKGILIAAAGLAAIAAPAPGAAQGGGDYRAVGTEPFWSVTFAGGRMTYDDAEGRRTSVRTPRAMQTRAGRIYRAPRFTVRIFRGRECSDGMSDRRYADTVQVEIRGRSLAGCGGAILAPTTLAGTSWQIVAIDGAAIPVAAASRYTLNFTADGIGGRAGCNSFSGPYRVGRDGLRAGSLTITRMLCQGPAGHHERVVTQLLREGARLFYPDGGTMIMRGVNGGEIRLRRAI